MCKKDKIVIIGANEFQNRLILKAKEMGYETHVFAWKRGDVGEKNADFFYPISIVEKEKILEECRKIRPLAVTTIASDLAVVTVNYVAENMGLPCNGIDTVERTTNKYEMRKCLDSFGLPVPRYLQVTDSDDVDNVDFSYPLIVKPTDRSGSRGVTKVFNKCELKEAIEYATKYSFAKSAIVEEFLKGDEYSCECISYLGRHKLLAITKKYTTGSPHFIETGHLEPAGLNVEMYEKVEGIVMKALDALLITTGASHSEIKIDKHGNVGIIEIGARMGGDCIGSDLVNLSTGYDFLKMTIQTARGEEPDLERKHEPQYSGIRFIFNKKDLLQMQKYEEGHSNLIYRKWIETEEEREVEDSSTRLGYYIVAGKDQQEILEVFK